MDVSNRRTVPGNVRSNQESIQLRPLTFYGAVRSNSNLASANYDCVVIGAGVRLPPQGLEVFEAVCRAIGADDCAQDLFLIGGFGGEKSRLGHTLVEAGLARKPPISKAGRSSNQFRCFGHQTFAIFGQVFVRPKSRSLERRLSC